MKTDFNKITSEELEFLAEDILRKKGYNLRSRASRGPDGGRDIIASREFTDEMGVAHSEIYLVECKHFSRSRRSVREKDIGNFSSKIAIHGANRYLIVCTTRLSGTVRRQLEAVSNDNFNGIKCHAWCQNDLEDFLQRYPDLKERYLGQETQPTLEERLVTIANYLQEHHFEAHRGAVLLHPGCTVVFGNDGYGEDKEKLDAACLRVRKEVRQLRKNLKMNKMHELGFGVSDDQYTWALAVDTPLAKRLNDEVWSFYPSGGSNNRRQYDVAFYQLWTYWDKPFFKGIA